MNRPVFKISAAATLIGLALSLPAHAALILDQSITTGAGGFVPDAATTTTSGNDLPGVPATILFGQLLASGAGIVDFYYVGNEAGYTNTLVLTGPLVSGASSYSTAGLPDEFAPPDTLIGSISVGAGQYLGFKLCTDGGDSVGSSGRCAANDSAASLIEQYNYVAPGTTDAGYRSIAFRALSSYSPTGGLSGPGFGTSYASTSTLDSLTWAIFWDDSGAKNDDNHDDFIAIARYRAISVPEPSTLFLLGAGLLGSAALRRRRAK
jgi:PEP-CTERM motif-containing protein